MGLSAMGVDLWLLGLRTVRPGAVHSREHPIRRWATLPHRGTRHRTGWVEGAHGAGWVPAGRVAAGGVVARRVVGGWVLGAGVPAGCR
jgi:hypothetical protein